MKKVWRDRLTTVFPRQGHYALDPGNISTYLPADISMEHIGELINHDFSTLPDTQKMDGARQEAL